MTQTLKLIRALVKKPLQYVHVSQKNYFKKLEEEKGRVLKG